MDARYEPSEGEAPRFSVVIPTYDRPELVARAVASVLAQDYGDFELLVVDDASLRDPAEALSRFADPRIRLIRRDRNGGAAAALNTGIDQARGELIAILGDDDEFFPTFLSATDRAFAAAPPEVGFSWSGVRVVEDTSEGERLVEEGVWRPEFRDREAALRGFLMSRRIGSNCGVTVRRRCFEEAGGFDETLRRAEDTDFFLRLVRRYDFVVIPTTEVKVHHHAGPRLTTYDGEFARSYGRILESHSDVLCSDGAAWSALYYKAGWLHYHGGDRARARSFLLRALRRRPWNVKAWAALALFELVGSRGKSLHRRLSKWKMRRA